MGISGHRRVTAHQVKPYPKYYPTSLLPTKDNSLVVDRILRIRQIKDHNRMRLRTTTIRKLLREVNTPIKVHTSVLIEVDVQRLKVSGRVDESDLTGLDEVVRDDEVFLVRGDFDIVGSDAGLVFVWVVEALDVVEVADVEGGDVVGGREG